MNRHSFTALLMAIAVVSVIVGFAIYFNSPNLNKTSSAQQQVERFVSAGTTVQQNGTTTIKLDKAQFQNIDKSQFRMAPEFAQISGYINTPPIKLSDLK